MAALPHHELTFTFGLLGNVVSFLVFLAPVPTFYRIVKRKSTEGFQSIPYSVALFSAMLLLYYAFLKTNALFLITINSIGCFIESVYLTIYLIYGTKNARIYTIKLLILFNFGAYGLIVIVTFVVWKGSTRVSVVGWICAAFSVSVFAAPLSIMRRVVKTKSVEYMPLSLSFFLTLCAVMWFFYGLLLKDYYIATPNILGFTFGITQMTLYAVYKDGNKKGFLPESKGDLEICKAAVQENNANEVKTEEGEVMKEDSHVVVHDWKHVELANAFPVVVVEVPEDSKTSVPNEEDGEAAKRGRVHGRLSEPADSNV